ncbi:MAG: DUF167 domain-containing protein [Actinomycetia bacterium]|nr:DUF167 domain-containing protein [Actinomycetes bacterium]
MRLSVGVRPAARRTAVSGRYGQPAPGVPDVLCVAVTARAVDGAATDAVLQAVAAAFDLPTRSVRLVTGRTSRTKVLELDLAATAARERLDELLGD